MLTIAPKTPTSKVVIWKHALLPGMNEVTLPKSAPYLTTALWQKTGCVIYSIHKVAEKEPMRTDKVYVALTGETFDLPDNAGFRSQPQYLGTVQTSHGMVGHVFVVQFGEYA